MILPLLLAKKKIPVPAEFGSEVFMQMPKAPQIAVIVSSYQRSRHLRRSLLSIAHQHDVAGQMEVVVADDGSTDGTEQVVQTFADSAPFPVYFTSHRHEGFQLARSRNEGVRASRAPYLLFVDGDCILPPDHVAIHLRCRQRGVVMAGDCIRLDKETSDAIVDETIRRGDFVQMGSPAEHDRLRTKAFRAKIYSLLRIPMRPRLTGNNIGIWREDLERVNGFDEKFVGWGLEDRDLQFRLSRTGFRCRSILSSTMAFHLWHEPHPTCRRNGEGTENLKYYQRKGRPAFCCNGLTKREP